jgi:hypothetical protein
MLSQPDSVKVCWQKEQAGYFRRGLNPEFVKIPPKELKSKLLQLRKNSVAQRANTTESVS